MIEWVELGKLTPSHPLRNQPLSELKAEYRNLNSKLWCEVRPAYGISKKTYNQLSDVWTKWDVWRVPIEAWDEKRIEEIGQNGNTGEHYEQTDYGNT